MKNTHLRRQEDIFEPQRTGSTPTVQIYLPSLHLGIFDHNLPLHTLFNAHLRRFFATFDSNRMFEEFQLVYRCHLLSASRSYPMTVLGGMQTSLSIIALLILQNLPITAFSRITDCLTSA